LMYRWTMVFTDRSMVHRPFFALGVVPHASVFSPHVKYIEHYPNCAGEGSQYSGSRQPKRDSGLPLPCAAGDGGRGEGAPSACDAPCRASIEVLLSPALFAGERPGEGAAAESTETQPHPARGSPLSRRSLPGEGPGGGASRGMRHHQTNHNQTQPRLISTSLAQGPRLAPVPRSNWPLNRGDSR
jgi:hypothetical protein